MPVAFLDITPDLLVELCKAFRGGDGRRSFYVTANGLPADTKFLRVEELPNFEYYSGPPIIRMTLESESFTEGEILPSVVAMFYQEKAR